MLKFADYLGYENGCKKFALNLTKALKSGYFPCDIKKLIRDLKLEVEGGLASLERDLSALQVTITWNSTDATTSLVFPSEVFNAIKSYLTKNITYKVVGRSGDQVSVKLTPCHTHKLVNLLRSLEIPINDPGRLLVDKTLMFKPELRNVELRPYQKEALQKWVENGGSGIIALPTGTGKSLIAIAAIVEKAVKTLVVAYTKEQVYQWKDFIERYTTIPPNHVGLFYSEEKKLAPITVTTYQSAFRNMNILSPHFGMIVVDEVHHLPADKFKYIAYHTLARYKMGLSATPEREDGRHLELFPLLGGLIYYKSPSELAEQGYLAPYEVITIRVDLSPQERLVYRKIRERIEQLVTQLPDYVKAASGRDRFRLILEEARKGNNIAKEILGLQSELRMLIALSNSKIDKAIEIAERELERGNKIIVFTQFVDQAKEIARRIHGYLLTGETPDFDRKRILEEFKSAKSGVLVVTTVGDEGLDIPDASVGIIVSGTGSRRQFIQRLGRLLRPKVGGQKAVLYEIVARRTPEELQAMRRKLVEPGDQGETV